MNHTREIKWDLQAGKDVIIDGWLSNKRDHGGLLFWEVRKSNQIIQVVFHRPKEAAHIPNESIVKIYGKVVIRQEDQRNLNAKNGNIEIIAEKYELISKAIQCPFYPNDEVSEELKAQHRVLYLRSDKMQNILKVRSDLILFIHQLMNEWQFTMVQTPLLTVSSPEGARDFIVPSRLQKGKFYALPQAPQIFKQLLMCGGLSRYYQIAPCFRDESARSTRLYGEFYQIDFEMSLVEQEDVLQVLENIVREVLVRFSNKSITHTRMTYWQCMDKYGSDKPDLRNPLILEDFTHLFERCGMALFEKMIQSGAIVKGIRVKHVVSKPEREKCLSFALQNGFKATYVNREQILQGPIAKFLPLDVCEQNETIFFVCEKDGIYEKASMLRDYLGKSILKDEMAMLTVLDFPMYEKEGEQIIFKHNPFSKIKAESENIESIIAYQYDLVLNGYEISSGSIRENNWQKLVENFVRAGHDPLQVEKNFRALIQSFKYGCPPHGGAAIGLERLLMIILDENNVRETVAFPLNTQGQDALCGAPSSVEPEFLEELGISLLEKTSLIK